MGVTTPIPSERKPYLPCTIREETYTHTVREETLATLHRGYDYTDTIREETLPALCRGYDCTHTIREETLPALHWGPFEEAESCFCILYVMDVATPTLFQNS